MTVFNFISNFIYYKQSGFVYASRNEKDDIYFYAELQFFLIDF